MNNFAKQLSVRQWQRKYFNCHGPRYTFHLLEKILKHTESFEWRGTGMAHFRLARKDAWAMFC